MKRGTHVELIDFVDKDKRTVTCKLRGAPPSETVTVALENIDVYCKTTTSLKRNGGDNENEIELKSVDKEHSKVEGDGDAAEIGGAGPGGEKKTKRLSRSAQSPASRAPKSPHSKSPRHSARADELVLLPANTDTAVELSIPASVEKKSLKSPRKSLKSPRKSPKSQSLKSPRKSLKSPRAKEAPSDAAAALEIVNEEDLAKEK